MPNTAGHRVYAIGDIHGCLAEFAEVIARVRTDLENHPHPQPLLVLIGDYIDRGPDSRGVMDALITLEQAALPTVFLIGNHDAMLLDYLSDPVEWASQKYHWFHAALGGDKTVASYGVADADPYDPAAVQSAIRAAVPDTHREFLERATLYKVVGDYLFVHAGIRPGIPLEDQVRDDLIWIRDPFLLESGPHPHIIVHGHTVVPRVQHHHNRIAIDTGAVFGGTLSCLVFEGAEVWDLQPNGRLACPPGTGLN
ncbi:MAG: metallophosphoesterase family protein [Pseudomonadota bacterium]